MKGQDNIYTSADIKALQSPTFSEASTRENIKGDKSETYTTILGKIKKWFADLQIHFFNMVGQPADTTDPTKTIPGLATLDEYGHIPTSQLPSYVDDVLEGYYNHIDGKFYKQKTIINYTVVTPVGTENPKEEWWYEKSGADYYRTTDTTVVAGKTYYQENATYTDAYTPETGKVYVDLFTNLTYRWSGSIYVLIGSDLTLGETSGTAYRGDRGKVAYEHATDASKLTTAQTEKLYSFSVTSEGHVGSVTEMKNTDLFLTLGIVNLVYPVGAVYTSTVNTNPGTWMTGTTWELLPDGYLRNNASAASGGSLTTGSTTLTTEQIPSHSHTATTSSSGAHTHTGTTSSSGAHTHTSTTSSSGGHTHNTDSKGGHTHTGTTSSSGAHTHTGTTSSSGAHTHGLTMKGSVSGWNTPAIAWPNKDAKGELSWTGWNTGTGADRLVYNEQINFSIDSAGGHTHTMTTSSSGGHTHTMTTSSSGAHTHTTDSKGAHTHTLTTSSSGGHTHTMTTSSSGGHTHTLTTQAIGGGKGHDHSIEPTYVRVYAFKRTA